MCIVYGLRDQRSKLYFYVGSTKFTAAHRLKQHFDMIRLGENRNRHFVRKVKNIGETNVVIDVLAECSPSERFEIEHQWIKGLLALGHPLTNIVHNPATYTRAPARNKGVSEFVLRPDHFMSILEAYLFGYRRTDDVLLNGLRDVVEELSKILLLQHFDDFMAMFGDSLAKAHNGNETDRQAAGIYQRIFDMLECG